MAIISRRQYDHPALATAGGSALHAAIENLYTVIGNDLSARYNTAASVANSAVTTFTHNFGVQFSDLKILLYTGTHPNLVRVADPVASGWIIAANGGNLKTQIDVTAPSSGGPHTFAVITVQTRGSEKLDELDDVDFGTPPIDGQFLIYDSGTTKWLPAYLKYKSETATISSNTLTPTTGTNIQRITTGAADLQMIASPIAGKVYVLINDTGTDFLLKNDTGATAANRIYTGTGIDLTLKSQAAVTLIYNSGVSRWIVGGGSGGGGLATSLKTALFTASAGQHYLVDNSASAFTGTLPAGSSGSVIRFSDNSRVWASRNFTITPASGEIIDGLAADESLVCDLSGAFVQLMWNGTKWIVDTNGFAASISSGSLSGGQGLGKKNYIGNPNNSTNWLTGGSSVTVATESSAANLPSQITQSTAIAITRVSGTTGYAAFRFEMDRADYGKKFEIGFDQKTAFTTEGYQVQAFAGSVFGTYGTQLTVSTAALTSLTGSFVSTIDMPGSVTPFIEFRIIATGASGTAPLFLNNVYFGPGLTSQGAAVSEWISYTPTGAWSTNTTYTGKYRRVGNTMELDNTVVCSGAPTATDLSINLPTGFTIDTTQVSSFTNLRYPSFGTALIVDESTRIYVGGLISGSTSSILRVTHTESGNIGVVNDSQPFTFGNLDSISIRATIPIAEWAGNGTVNLGAGAQVEYASNSSTSTTATDTTSFAYGPGGNKIQAITVALSRRVRFQYPIQADDQIILELSSDQVSWRALDNFIIIGGGGVVPYQKQNAKSYGATVYSVVNSTDVDVNFGTYEQPSGATYDSAGEAWRAGGSDQYWRVRKVKASSPVGFGLAGTDGSSGLYKAGSAPGLTTGAAVAAGYIGETVRTALTASGNTSAAGVYINSSATFTLQPGVYTISVCAYVSIITTTTNTTPAGGLALRTTVPATVEQVFYSLPNVATASTINQPMYLHTTVNVSSATIYQISAQSNTASNYTFGILADGAALGGASGTVSSFVRTVRIA